MQPNRTPPDTTNAEPTSERPAPLPLDKTTEKEVDEALDQSFPASDPPAHQLEKQ